MSGTININNIQPDFSFTKDHLTNQLEFASEFSLNRWGTWNIYPHSLVSYLLKFDSKDINSLTYRLPCAWTA